MLYVLEVIVWIYKMCFNCILFYLVMTYYCFPMLSILYVCIIKGIYIEEALCIFCFMIFLHRMYSMNYIFYLVYNVQFILCDV